MILFFILLFSKQNIALQPPTIACEGTNLNLLCPDSNTQIVIDYANYGRTKSFVCPKNGFDKLTNCSSINATYIVADRCKNRSFCIINATNDIFGDSCLNTYKYLEVNFTCVNNFMLEPGPVLSKSNCDLHFEEEGCTNDCEKQCYPEINSCSRLYCRLGCTCVSGYKRDVISGKCVQHKHCPLKGSQLETHEIFSVCNADCQHTCLRPIGNCEARCVPGYICITNYIRDEITGQCVLPSQCSNMKIQI